MWMLLWNISPTSSSPFFLFAKYMAGTNSIQRVLLKILNLLIFSSRIGKGKGEGKGEVEERRCTNTLLAIWTNISSNLNKYILQFEQIHSAIWTNGKRRKRGWGEKVLSCTSFLFAPKCHGNAESDIDKCKYGNAISILLFGHFSVKRT